MVIDTERKRGVIRNCVRIRRKKNWIDGKRKWGTQNWRVKYGR